MLTRRFLLAAAAVTSVAAAIPKPVAAAISGEAPARLPAWVVGTPGEYNWEIIRARTESRAIKLWTADNCQHDYEEDEDGNPESPCECMACAWEVGASRVPEFDEITRPTPGDWMRAGLGHTCSRCGDETDPQNSGHAIGDEAVCDDCLTPEERDSIREALA
ncbi:hypothetical protein ASE63_08295 [Bosea sp. Root381]|uniref:hypothetical protein n=1 Tax=Bosea sp. Root381 TaxID=1736524 RepID=UPI0006F254DA|nr:hypothetical protein [Bosea sp. Root381]KRE00092.1 hypothetical protein ASE63_08295 [Bosea sp. Root381]